MHDVAWAERSGLPAVAVLSDEFVPQARHNAVALGQPALAHCTVPHPIQCNTDAQVAAKAEAVLPAVLRALSDADAPAPPCKAAAGGGGGSSGSGGGDAGRARSAADGADCST
jgi:hypothetical protein